MMIGNCFCLKNNSKTKMKKIASFFIIFSAKLKIKGKRNGKEWCGIIGELYVDGECAANYPIEVFVNQYGWIDPAQPLFKMATVNA